MFFLAGTVGLLRFPDTLHAPARAHQGRQPRRRAGGAPVCCRTIAGLLRGAEAAARCGCCCCCREPMRYRSSSRTRQGAGTAANERAGPLPGRSSRNARGNRMTRSLLSRVDDRGCSTWSPLLLIWRCWTVYTTVATRCTFVASGRFRRLRPDAVTVWVRLAGIDVALTEAAIGGGLTGAPAARRGGPPAQRPRPRPRRASAAPRTSARRRDPGRLA
jgi:hypothetical protein